MDQDVTHRVSAPSAAADGAEVFARAEAALLPEGEAGPGMGLCRPEWGEPTRFGTAGEEGAAEGHGRVGERRGVRVRRRASG